MKYISYEIYNENCSYYGKTPIYEQAETVLSHLKAGIIYGVSADGKKEKIKIKNNPNKNIEVTGIYGYNAFLNGRYVHFRNIENGMNYCRFYPVHNKRKLVAQLRKEGMIVYHSLYRDFNKN